MESQRSKCGDLRSGTALSRKSSARGKHILVALRRMKGKVLSRTLHIILPQQPTQSSLRILLSLWNPCLRFLQLYQSLHAARNPFLVLLCLHHSNLLQQSSVIKKDCLLLDNNLINKHACNTKLFHIAYMIVLLESLISSKYMPIAHKEDTGVKTAKITSWF